MSIKIASFNLNNLFERAKVLELEGFSADAKNVLSDVAKLNVLLEKDSYAGNTGKEIVALLKEYFVTRKKDKLFIINELRGKLFSVQGNKVTLKATGRGDWLGFIEFTKIRTTDAAVVNTARVLDAVDADIVCTVEVDNRLALRNFNDLMHTEFAKSYNHCMLIDGNDERGIDLGLLSKFEIESINSHVDDSFADANGKLWPIFSRDCPEYKVKIADDTYITILCNHFKSKGYGSPASSNAKRKKQADRVAEILGKYDLANDYVVVAGDFNDTPDSQPLQSLMNLENLHDVFDWQGFAGQERGTYHTGKQQIDYVMVSKPLFDKITEVGIERRGFFKKRNHVAFPEVKDEKSQASDHACVWATFDI